MKFSFDGNSGLILVTAAIASATKNEFVTLALDTGANITVINREVIESIGFDVASNAKFYELATGNGIIFVPQIVLPKIYALGVVKESFPIFVHSLPTSAQIDGVLGLDFPRNHILTLDFKSGEISFD